MDEELQFQGSIEFIDSINEATIDGFGSFTGESSGSSTIPVPSNPAFGKYPQSGHQLEFPQGDSEPHFGHASPGAGFVPATYRFGFGAAGAGAATVATSATETAGVVSRRGGGAS